MVQNTQLSILSTCDQLDNSKTQDLHECQHSVPPLEVFYLKCSEADYKGWAAGQTCHMSNIHAGEDSSLIFIYIVTMCPFIHCNRDFS